MSSLGPYDRLAILWTGHGSSLSFLGAINFIVLASGVGLQLLAIRSLSHGDYATFVVGIGFANAAGIVGNVVQPIAAIRSSVDATGPIVPVPHGAAVVVLAATFGAIVSLLVSFVGFWEAMSMASLLPLHAIIAVGLGRLQAHRAFRRISVVSVSLVPSRLLFAAAFGYAGWSTGASFVTALLASAVLAASATALVGGLRGLYGAFGSDRRLAVTYAAWGALAVLIHVDVLVVKLAFSETDASRYAAAFTLGKLGLFAVGPIALVLLPVAQPLAGGAVRSLSAATVIVTLVVGLAMFAGLGFYPETVARLVFGESQPVGSAGLIRIHLLIGIVNVLMLLQSTLLFARGVRPPLVPMMIAASLVGMTAIGRLELTQIATVQLAANVAAAAIMLWRSIQVE